jgi:alpha-galactosidase
MYATPPTPAEDRMSDIVISHEGIEIILCKEGCTLRLLGMYPAAVASRIKQLPHSIKSLERSLETDLQCTGEDHAEHHGFKLNNGNPGRRLAFTGMKEESRAGSRRITLSYTDARLHLAVRSHYELVPGVPVVRRSVEVINEGGEPVGIENVFSAVINGIGIGADRPWDERLWVHLPFSSWYTEGQWRRRRLWEYNMRSVKPFVDKPLRFGLNALAVTQTGSWSSLTHLPMAMLEDEDLDTTWFWQIEHNGSWNWEIGETWEGFLYVGIGGPNEIKNHWWKQLQPGESFTTVPVAVGVTHGGFQQAVQHLTQYRRTIIAPHPDNRTLPVIFNDYMNCLWADPTTEKELPLIDAAARAGAEYFVIDAGWFVPPGDQWSSGVGIWQADDVRFPGGLSSLMDRIRAAGMIPGLWLEIEVASTHSALKDRPDSWFFCRHGKRIIDNGRWFLDFRNPEVVAYVDDVIDRLVRDFGIGYIKNDYNTTTKQGTDLDADSPGDGLLEHNRAFVAWIDALHKRHPHLVFENCGSGGLRMDYALLSRAQLQSFSDQSDYRCNPSIVPGVLAACLPEQLAVWSYPINDRDPEEAVFNMVNAMLSRIHLSGRIAELKEETFSRVQEGIAVYKTYRAHLPRMHPVYPAGTLPLEDRNSWHAFGLAHDSEPWALLAVWRLGSDRSSWTVPLTFTGGVHAKVTQIYPQKPTALIYSNPLSPELKVTLEKPWTARLFRVAWGD